MLSSMPKMLVYCSQDLFKTFFLRCIGRCLSSFPLLVDMSRGCIRCKIQRVRPLIRVLIVIDGCSRVICPEAINAVHESFKQGSNEQWSNDYWFSVLVFFVFTRTRRDDVNLPMV